ASAGATWQLESVVPAPANSNGSFGWDLTMSGDLMVAVGGTTVYSFQFNPEAAIWSPAGWELNFMLFPMSFATDGERIAFCSSSCRTIVRDENGEWILEADIELHRGGEAGGLQVSGEWMLY